MHQIKVERGESIWLLLLYGLVRRAVVASITAEPLSREFLTPVAVVYAFITLRGLKDKLLGSLLLLLASSRGSEI